MVVRKRWGVVAIAVGVGVFVRFFVLPTAEIHYRLTASFENAQGDVITAQGVWAAYYATNSGLLPDPPRISMKISGDAIRIDNGGHLFWIVLSSGRNCLWRKWNITNSTNGPAGIIFQSFGINGPMAPARRVMSLPVPGMKAEVGVCDLPQIVSIDDANDPMSARPVLFDPDGRASCCDLVFKSATIEILRNSEKITETDVRQRFPWVPESSPKGTTTREYYPKGQDIPKGFSLTDTSLSIRGL